jgi:hypothetical protein
VRTAERREPQVHVPHAAVRRPQALGRLERGAGLERGDRATQRGKLVAAVAVFAVFGASGEDEGEERVVPGQVGRRVAEELAAIEHIAPSLVRVEERDHRRRVAHHRAETFL